MEDGLLSIGEMALLCNVTKRTLRYYDIIDLIKPAFTNPESGYRFYEPYQVARVSLVNQMKELGVSLEDVGKCMTEKGAEISIKEFLCIIGDREKEILEEMKALKKHIETIEEYKIEYSNIQSLWSSFENEVHIVHIDKRYLISKRFEGKLDKQMFGRTFSEIGSALYRSNQDKCQLLPKIGGYFCRGRNQENTINEIGFFTDQSIILEPYQHTAIEDGFYATYRYVGEYSKIDAQYERLHQYLKGLGYSIMNYCVELYQVSVNTTLKDSEFITDLQIPIRIKNNS